jgi:dipeptidase E
MTPKMDLNHRAPGGPGTVGEESDSPKDVSEARDASTPLGARHLLGGASAGSLCWFEEGTTDSRPKEVTRIECLGFLKGSHSPHYDGEEVRRPTYHRMIRSGELKPGYACDNDAGLYFLDHEVRRVVATRPGAKCYYVSVVNGQVVEKVLEPEFIE